MTEKPENKTEQDNTEDRNAELKEDQLDEVAGGKFKGFAATDALLKNRSFSFRIIPNRALQNFRLA